MLEVHQLDANFVYVSFHALQVAYSGFITTFLHLPAGLETSE